MHAQPQIIFFFHNGCATSAHSYIYKQVVKIIFIIYAKSIIFTFETSSRAHLLTLFSVAMPALLLQPRWRICIPIEHFKCKNNSDHLLRSRTARLASPPRHGASTQTCRRRVCWSCSMHPPMHNIIMALRQTPERANGRTKQKMKHCCKHIPPS